MSNSTTPDFSKFVPGFDFLQSLTQGKSSPMPGAAAWIAPTLDPKELDKRIEELKAVQFWLDQNATALKATIQALEVQKMTLATLKGMNMDVDAMAKAFQFPMATTSTPSPSAPPAAKAPPKPEAPPSAEPSPVKKPFADSFKASTTPAVDPVQLWTSLTQQFQQIASTAMQEVAKQTAVKSSASHASNTATAAKKPAKKAARKRPTAK
jgi:hypothetical protein